MTGCRNCEQRTDGDCGAHGARARTGATDDRLRPVLPPTRADRLPCGHPLGCGAWAQSGPEACSWCVEIARLTAELAEARDGFERERLRAARCDGNAAEQFDIAERLRAELAAEREQRAETEARLAAVVEAARACERALGKQAKVAYAENRIGVSNALNEAGARLLAVVEHAARVAARGERGVPVTREHHHAWTHLPAYDGARGSFRKRFRCDCGVWGWSRGEPAPLRTYAPTHPTAVDCERAYQSGKPLERHTDEDVTVRPMSAARGAHGGYVPPGGGGK